MADAKRRIVLDDFSGGRNGADTPLGPDFAPNQVVDAVNVDWYRTRGARKRNGSSNVSMTGSGSAGNTISFLGRHVPSTSEADAELWSADDGTPCVLQRLDNSTTWTTPSTTDLPSATFWEMTGASCAGLFFLSYNSGTNRLHCYDSASSTVRRTGIAPGSNAPTAANTGAGAYAATLRYYRVRWVLTSAYGQVWSEPTPSVSFTPSGAGSAARITRPSTPASEGITAWFAEASADNTTFYIISSPTAVATTTVDDTNAVDSYSSGVFTASQLTGTFRLQKSYRFIAADQNRLIGFGSWTSTDPQNAVEWSAVIGSLDVGDVERVDTNGSYRLFLDENDSGVPTGLAGPVWGNFYAFKSRQFWELAPTGESSSPYRARAISKEIGCVQGRANCRGEDRLGNPCLYFVSHRGVYQYGPSGLVYVSRGIEDLILGPTSTMNMAATRVIAHCVYHQDKRQVWVWFATGSSNDPDTLCVYSVQTGGWARYTGTIATARCSVMFANSIGATMGFQMVPYIGSSASTNVVKKADDSAVTADAGTAIQAYITTRPLAPGGPGFNGEIGDLVVLAPAATGVTLTATITPDFGASPNQTGTALLTATGSETRVSRRLEGSAVAGAQFLQIQIGDGSAASNAWSFDHLVVPMSGQEAVSR